MIQKLSQNYLKYLNAYRLYAIISVAVFIFVGELNVQALIQRVIIAVVIAGFCIGVYNLMDLALKKHASSVAWEKRMKGIRFQLSFFFVMGLVATVLGLIYLALSPIELPLVMLFTSVTLGLMLTSLRNIYEFIL